MYNLNVKIIIKEVKLMEMKELFEKFAEATDDVAIYLFGKALQEAIDTKLDALKPKIEALDCGKYTVSGADHQINVLMKQNSTISADAVAELSEAELRKSYKLTETALKNLGRNDLIEKYKSTSEVKSFRVEKLK